MSDGHYILDAKGKPVPEPDLLKWARWMETPTRMIAKTKVNVEEGSAEVSTVFLGLDHRFGTEGPPLVFETMVFGGPLDQEQDRYSTKAEALAGHQALARKALAASISWEALSIYAAAPKLLEACKALLHHFCGGGERTHTDASVMALAQAAIAEAEKE